MNSPLVISLSPRSGGNSDAAADHYVRTSLVPCRFLRLREFAVRQCSGCGACASAGVCIFAPTDDAEDLFRLLDDAPSVVLTAPVYFYHLPAMAKAWIDRAQSRYMARERGLRSAGPKRAATVVLIAGRARGDRLFDGIVPTLRYFLDIFDFEIQKSIFLRGLDAPDAFITNEHALDAVAALARQ